MLIFALNKQKNVMNLLNFSAQYPDEASCKFRWKAFRDQQGVICLHCGSSEHYWKKDKECYECKSCRKRQSLRANTVMHGSQLPFRYWFMAIHLLTSTKRVFQPPNCNVNWVISIMIRYGQCFTGCVWQWVNGTNSMLFAASLNWMKAFFLLKHRMMKRINP